MTMRLEFMRASVIALALMAACMQAQQPRQPASSEDSLRGHEIDHPENLSGEWETSFNGAVYGLQIQLTTRIDGAPVTLLGARQTFHDALFEVYQRTGPTRKTGEGNSFSDDTPAVHWTQKRLIINRDGTTEGPAIHLDLAFDPVHSSWSGRFRLASFDRKVTLVRPCCAEKSATSPLVGTWARDVPMNNCIHIAQGREGSLVSWSDDLLTPGAYKYANGIQPPTETFEHYGTVANTTLLSPGSVAIEFNPLSPLCCPVQFVGKLSANGKAIVPAADEPEPLAHWLLMKGDSCVRR